MIVTFYSFKGGVGRSHLLVDVAARLAGQGLSVVVWDLDLEAPGIQKIPALKRLTPPPGGTLDLLSHLQKTGEMPPAKRWEDCLVTLPLEGDLAKRNGRLSFLFPRELDDQYEVEFAKIDWGKLFSRRKSAGPAFLHRGATLLRAELGYDVVLIDARTGLTPLGAVCVTSLPDIVVGVFNLNEQNLAGITRAHRSVTELHPQTPEGAARRFLLAANMVPDRPEEVRREKLQRLHTEGLEPFVTIPLVPELLLTDDVPALMGDEDRGGGQVARLTEEIRREYEARRASRIAEFEDKKRLASSADEFEDLRRRAILGRAKLFEERVAELFGFQGYRTTVDYSSANFQFDVLLEKGGALKDWVLVECKDRDAKVSQREVEQFASDAIQAGLSDGRRYRPVIVSRSGFVNHANQAAARNFVDLLTFDQLTDSLVDFKPVLGQTLGAFRGTALERLYVETNAVLERKPGEKQPLTEIVRRWIDAPGGRLLTLLGDFGAGKTSFSLKLASELAEAVREDRSAGRIPVLVDLRHSGGATAQLENVLTDHFQRVSSQAILPQALLHLNREGRLVIIFDGFDEVIGYAEPSRFVEHLRQLLRAAEGRAKVILTCRTHYFRDRLEAREQIGGAGDDLATKGATELYREVSSHSDVEIAHILELDDRQIDEYLRRAFPPPDDWKEFRRTIRETFNLENLAQRPFLLDLIVKSLPKIRAADPGGIISVADLYETYCAKWMDRDLHRVPLIRDRRWELVEHLARLMWEAPEARVHHTALYTVVSEFFGERKLNAPEKDALDFEVRTASFLKRTPEGHYSFAHRSFLEFFVARGIRRALQTGDEGRLDMRRVTREVAFFLECWEEREKIPCVVGAVLTAPVRPRVSENALFLLYFHAEARLRPLTGSKEEVPAPGAIRGEFGTVRPRVIELASADLSAAVLPGIDLGGANLAGADLRDAELGGANLECANLEAAVLAFADLEGAILRGARLNAAIADHLNGRGADFEGADLTDADLTAGSFVGSNLTGVGSEGTRWERAARWRARGMEPVPPPDLGDFELLLQRGHSGQVSSVAFSPDGQTLASGGDDSDLRLWDAATGKLLRTLEGHKRAITSVAFSPDGQTLASGGDDSDLRLWDAATGNLLRTLEGHKGPIFSVALSHDGRTLASGGSEQALRLWDAASGKLLHALEGHSDSTISVAFSPDGQTLASGGEDRALRVWDAASGRLLRTLEGHEHWVVSVAFSPDGRMLASEGVDHALRVWDVASGKLLRTLEGHESLVASVAFSPDGRTLASGGVLALRLWDVASGRLLRSLEGHESSVASVAFSPDGRTLAGGGGNHNLTLWDAASGNLLHTIEGQSAAITSVAFSPASRTLASGGHDHVLRLWDAASGKLLRTLEGHRSSITSVAFSPDGRTLASGGHDHALRLWDAASGELLRTLEGHQNRTSSVAFSPDGRTLAGGGGGNALRLWDAASGKLLRILNGSESLISSVAFSPDGRMLASGGGDKGLILWDAASGKLLRTLESHKNSISSVAFSPDGRMLASGGGDKGLMVWDAATGNLLRTLEGHKNGITSVAFSPDGQTLASGGDDNALRLWDAASGKLLHTLEGHKNSISSVAFSPDGQTLASGGDDSDLRLWDVAGRVPSCVITPVEADMAIRWTEAGDIDAPPEARSIVTFVHGDALYEARDVPERFSPEKVDAAFAALAALSSPDD